MYRFVSPLCLILALVMVILGFVILSIDAPEAGLDLHQARATGDEEYEKVLEAQLAQRQLSRTLLLWGLFGGSGLLAVLAFLAMRD